jgi:ABC-type sugar transport system ATPase subunit
MYLNIKMLEDFRTLFRSLKQGDEFNFDFSKHPEILIAGDNGCGKSTLVNIIRD